MREKRFVSMSEVRIAIGFSNMTGASAHREGGLSSFQLWPPFGSKAREKGFSCATMPLPRPRMINSNPLEGEIGALQRANSKGCFLASAAPWPVGDTPFRFFPMVFLRRRASTGTDLTRPACESPPVFERNGAVRHLPPIRDQHAYIQMSGLP